MDRKNWVSLESPLVPVVAGLLLVLVKTSQAAHDYFGRRAPAPDWWVEVPRVMGVWLLWGACTPLIFSLARRVPPTSLRNVLTHLGVFLAICFPFELYYWFQLPAEARVHIPILPHQFFRYGTAAGIYASILAAGWLRGRYLQQSRQTRELLTLQQELARTQMAAVRLQVDPLLVASTLERIERAAIDDPDIAERLIVTLGDFLRATVEQLDRGQLTLARDLDRLRACLALLPAEVTLDASAIAEAEARALSTPADLVAAAREAVAAGAGAIRFSLRGDALVLESGSAVRQFEVVPFAEVPRAMPEVDASVPAMPPRAALSARAIVFLILLACAFTRFVSYVGESPRDPTPLPLALFWVGVSALLTAAGCGVAIVIARRIARIGSAAVQVLLLFFATFAIAFAGELAFGLLFPQWLEVNYLGAMKNLYFTVARTRSLVAVQLLLMVVSFSTIALRRSEQELDVIALRARVREAQLRKLRNQLRPHFLFNVLNSILGRIGRDRPAAREMTAKLRRFLATTLELEPEELVPLAEELAAVENYLSIERNRVGDRMRVVVDVAPGALDARVPALLLQPVVENAVLHGVAPVSRPVTLRISARRAARNLLIEVADDGNGPEGEYREGIGLATTRALLRTIYGNAARVAVSGLRGAGFDVRISMPMR